MNLVTKDFIDYLKKKGVADNTLLSYERDIQQLTKYVESMGKRMVEVKSDDLLSYVSYMKTENKSNSTISRNIASIRAFYKYLTENKLISNNVADVLSAPKIERKELSILTTSEVEKLLEQPNLIELKGQRDKAMLELMYATGIRVSELVSLEVNDVNLSLGQLKVRMRDKDRVVPISNTCLKYLKPYIKKVRPLIIHNEAECALFVNTNGIKLTRQGFWKILKQYKDEAQINKELTPHTIRHSFAVHLLQNGAQIKSVQELLGHTDVAATMMYTHVADMKLKEEYEKAHPRV